MWQVQVANEEAKEEAAKLKAEANKAFQCESLLAHLKFAIDSATEREL